MILEALVTTLSADGVLNVAPMGPEVEEDNFRQFVLKPFQTATTFRNLVATREGVMHVTDDVLLLARAAIGSVDDAPTRSASAVKGRILLSAARFYEFRVTEIDDREERSRIVVETVESGYQRDLFGLNRGKHAVVEAAIFATRLALLPVDEVLARYREWAILVKKTGGGREREAFALLEAYVNQWIEGSKSRPE